MRARLRAVRVRDRRSHPAHAQARRQRTRVPPPRRAHCRCHGRSARARARSSRAQRSMAAAPTVSAAVWDNRRMKLQSKILSFALICIVGIAGIAAALLWRHPRRLSN